MAAGSDLDAQHRTGQTTLFRLANPNWRNSFPGGQLTVDEATADLWGDQPPALEAPVEWSPQRFADNENQSAPGTFGSPYNDAWSTEGGATIGYTTETSYSGSSSVKVDWPGGEGTGIARTWMHASGNDGDTCGATWAKLGETRWTGAAYRIPAPADHTWTRLLAFSYYQCFHPRPWSVIGAVLEHGQIQVWAEDYGGGTHHHQLLAGVPVPTNRWFRVDMGVTAGNPGHVELVVDGQIFRADGPTMTRPGAYVSAQHGFGTVTGPAVQGFYDDAYVATTGRP
jgi:hypothetical protein